MAKIDKLLERLSQIVDDIEDVQDDIKDLAGELEGVNRAGILEALQLGLSGVQAKYGTSSYESRACERLISKLDP